MQIKPQLGITTYLSECLKNTNKIACADKDVDGGNSHTLFWECEIGSFLLS